MARPNGPSGVDRALWPLRGGQAETGHGAPDLWVVLKQRLRVQGFVWSDHRDYVPKAIENMAGRLRDNPVKWRPDMNTALERAPTTFIGMLNGQNIAKTLVRLA